MILEDLCLPSRQERTYEYLGLDQLEHCLDKDHFLDYPFYIDYRYNSRGFRDEEWPADPNDLKEFIWCLGDSFTVGIGSPIEHTWPRVLAKITGRRTINISMDGASNQWIRRRGQQIIGEIAPRYMVVMWSHAHRREKDNLESLQIEIIQDFYRAARNGDHQDYQGHGALVTANNTDGALTVKVPDELRRVHYSYCHEHEDAQDLLDNVKCLNLSQGPTKIVNIFIPDTNIDILLKENQELVDDWHCLGTVPQKDHARDGHHFDIKTARWVAEAIAPLID